MTQEAAVTPVTLDRAKRFAWMWLILAVANCVLWGLSLNEVRHGFGIFGWLWLVLSLVQTIVSVRVIVAAARSSQRGGLRIGLIAGGVVATLGTLLAWMAGLLAYGLGAGGAWGRPLRLRGRQLHPNLRIGANWTRGTCPDPTGLDDGTRRALEALWLHDAQKEHASVPAFARISWLLSAVGAPPELLRGAQQAALEEIDHAERCFALAAGYGGRQHTVEPMPELIDGQPFSLRDPLSTLVYESVTDGVQLEDFNADVAALCAAVCEEPVTRAVLQQIAVEERSHAAFSLQLVRWVQRIDPVRAAAAVARALADLDGYARPTAVSYDKQALLADADPAALRRHGRLTDAEWADAWQKRLAATRSLFQSDTTPAKLDAGHDLRRPAPKSPRAGSETSAA